MVLLKDAKLENSRGEVYSTKYFHLQQLQSLLNFIETLPEGVTIDIAYCRFDPKVAANLFTHENYAKFKFIDSHDENINFTLEHNYGVYKAFENLDGSKVYPIQLLNLFGSFQDYCNRIESIKPEDYGANSFILEDDAKECDIMLALALIVRRPDIEVIFINKWADFFRVYTQFFGFSREECDSFFIYQRSHKHLKNMVFKDKETGKYSNGYIEPCEYEELKDFHRFLLIPGTLGTEKFKETIGERKFNDSIGYLENEIEKSYADIEDKKVKSINEIFDKLIGKE